MSDLRFVLLLLMIILFGCASDIPIGSDRPNNNIPNYTLAPGGGDKVQDISSVVKSVDVINLSSVVAEKVGVIFHFFVIEDNDLLLVDELSGTLSRVNKNGQLAWQISARRDDYRIFPSIDEAVLDPFRQHILVYNDYNVFAYNYDGEPIYVESRPDLDFFTLFPYSEDDFVYSTQGMINTIVSNVSKQLVWTRNKKVQGSYISALPYAQGGLVGGYPQFGELNGIVHYASTFRDTFYHLGLPEVTPAFTSSFTGPITMNEILESERIGNKLAYLVDNNIAARYGFAADDDRVVQTYQVGKDQFLALLDRETKKWTVNHQHLRFEQQTFRAPLLYNNGYLLRMIPKYKVKHYGKLQLDIDQVPVDWKEELYQLDEAFDGRGEQAIYLVKI